MTDKDAATVLEEAADLLLIHGRCTGALVNDEGQMCALGAMQQAAHGSPRHGIHGSGSTLGYLKAFSALGCHLGRAIFLWNNDPATSDDDVRDAFLLVAKDLRNEVTS